MIIKSSRRKKEEALFKKYPKIFAQRKLSCKVTCMCWGISCDEGWYPLIDTLCGYIQMQIDFSKLPQLEATQVKEKFGGLRFYYSWSESKHKLTKEQIEQGNRSMKDIESMISACENLSFKICEHCGSMDSVTQTKGWIRSLCPKCMKERKK